MNKSTIVIEALAADYARKNKGTSATQIMQLFGLSMELSRRAVRSAQQDLKLANAETVEAAMEFAKTKRAKRDSLMRRFPGLSQSQATRIEKFAATYNTEQAELDSQNLVNAIDYIEKNGITEIKPVSRQFNVNCKMLCTNLRKRTYEQIGKASQPAATRPLRNTLLAIVNGVEMSPRAVPARQWFDKCLGVKR